MIPGNSDGYSSSILPSYVTSRMSPTWGSGDDSSFCIGTEKHPFGPSFEIGDEIVVTYSGIADEESPAGLCNVVKIDLSDECYTKKYGDKFKPEIDTTVDKYISLPP